MTVLDEPVIDDGGDPVWAPRGHPVRYLSTSAQHRIRAPMARRPGDTCRAARLPRRALDPSRDHEPDRVDVRDGRVAYQGPQGPGSRAAGLAMAFELIEAADSRWRAVNGPHLVALVRAGARFDKGVIVERDQQVQEAAA
jgi:hypothetical protein